MSAKLNCDVVFDRIKLGSELNTEVLLKEGKKSLLSQTQEKLTRGLAINPISVTVESKNQGTFESKIAIRNHVLISDQPFGFHGENKGPKPSELVLAALAACQETTFRLYAEDMGIKINAISVSLTGIQDLTGFMGLDEKIPAGFSSIEGEVIIDSPATKEDLELLKKQVDRYCPVLDDLKRPVQVNIDVKKMK